ncbi:hypothetical protein GA0074692_4106 [Micromonospora pallida]|uniref:Uncharacterized protein n=1 Tax=Micromonospora pallida TaxID=145854 RepID=A0A1C6T1M7_9ACTN|nr:hypothetical protein GA0074692_4106 [Micromonospora pallida]
MDQPCPPLGSALLRKISDRAARVKGSGDIRAELQPFDEEDIRDVRCKLCRSLRRLGVRTYPAAPASSTTGKREPSVAPSRSRACRLFGRAPVTETPPLSVCSLSSVQGWTSRFGRRALAAGIEEGARPSRGWRVKVKRPSLHRRYRVARGLMFERCGDACHLCGHAGAREAYHLVPIRDLPNQVSNADAMRPAHGALYRNRGGSVLRDNRCPTCGKACNQSRGRSRCPRWLTGREGDEDCEPPLAWWRHLASLSGLSGAFARQNDLGADVRAGGNLSGPASPSSCPIGPVW